MVFGFKVSNPIPYFLNVKSGLNSVHHDENFINSAFVIPFFSSCKVTLTDFGRR